MISEMYSPEDHDRAEEESKAGKWQRVSPAQQPHNLSQASGGGGWEGAGGGRLRLITF